MKPKDKKASDGGEMPLAGHLKELRTRLIVILIVFVVGSVVCFSFAGNIVDLLTALGKSYQYKFVYIRPQELLLVYFSLSLIGGAVISFPVIAYNAYGFASPGLKASERRFFILALIFGTMCFCLGVFFAYKILLPFMLRFLISFSADTAITASITIQEYVSFLMLIFIIFGIIFELPVISTLLTGLGIIKTEWLIKARKIMIVVIFLLAAVITPPDIVSQIMVAIPIVILYEISIFLSRLVTKLKGGKDEDSGNSSEAEQSEE